MKALLNGSGPLGSLQRSDPDQPPSLSSSRHPLRQLQSPQHAQQGQHVQQAQQHSPQHAQQAQPEQHAYQAQRAQQASQSPQPIRVSLLPGSNKLLTPTQVKELSWQSHLKLYKVYHTAPSKNALASCTSPHKPYYT